MTHAVRARWGARLALVLTVAALLVPVGQVEVWATPVTLSETIEGLDAVEVAPDRDGVRLAGGATAGHGTADAGEPAATTSRSEATDAPLTFNAVGFAAPADAAAIRVRTSVDGDDWSDWDEVDFVHEIDGPDPGTDERTADGDGQHTEPLWVGEATHLQFEVDGADAGDVEVTVIDSLGLSDGPVQRRWDTDLGTAADAVDELDLISRAEWGADESLGSDKVSVADEVHMGVVHHTAHASTPEANSYSEWEAPAVIRAMHSYHTRNLGWKDLGYNVLVDRFGNVYEGRQGGFERGVIGAHAAGYNTGSFGVSVIGNFKEQQAPAAAIDALTTVIGVKSAIHGIDPTGTTDEMDDDERLPTIIGHTDVGNTSCPGLIQNLLPQIREEASEVAVRFPDVPSSSPHRDAILSLSDAGVTTGCELNLFCPSDELNRGQASSFVGRALQIQPIDGQWFSDVPVTNAHAGPINALADLEWMIGYDDGSFGPWDRMTRGQLATLLARSLELPLEEPASDPYPDVPRDSTHAPAIAALYEIGVRGNCGSGRFCPDDVAKRDSTASFVHMVLEARSVMLFPQADEDD